MSHFQGRKKIVLSIDLSRVSMLYVGIEPPTLGIILICLTHVVATDVGALCGNRTSNPWNYTNMPDTCGSSKHWYREILASHHMVTTTF
jgi:hypothetical protein